MSQLTERIYKSDIIKKMKAVGIYNEGFTYSINVLAKTMVEYDKTLKLYEELGSKIVIKHTNKAGSTNLIKNPVYLAIEKLRVDILNYSKELGLTPSSLKRINEKGLMAPKKSKLESFMENLK